MNIPLKNTWKLLGYRYRFFTTANTLQSVPNQLEHEYSVPKTRIAVKYDQLGNLGGAKPLIVCQLWLEQRAGSYPIQKRGTGTETCLRSLLGGRTLRMIRPSSSFRAVAMDAIWGKSRRLDDERQGRDSSFADLRTILPALTVRVCGCEVCLHLRSTGARAVIEGLIITPGVILQKQF